MQREVIWHGQSESFDSFEIDVASFGGSLIAECDECEKEGAESDESRWTQIFDERKRALGAASRGRWLLTSRRHSTHWERGPRPKADKLRTQDSDMSPPCTNIGSTVTTRSRQTSPTVSYWSRQVQADP